MYSPKLDFANDATIAISKYLFFMNIHIVILTTTSTRSFEKAENKAFLTKNDKKNKNKQTKKQTSNSEIRIQWYQMNRLAFSLKKKEKERKENLPSHNTLRGRVESITKY